MNIQILKSCSLATALFLGVTPLSNAKDIALIEADANSVTVTEMKMAEPSTAAINVSSHGTVTAAPAAQVVTPVVTNSVITPVSSVVTQPAQTTTYVEQTPLTIYTQNEMGQPVVEAGVLSTSTSISTPATVISPVTVYQSEYLGQPDYYWSGQRWVYLPAN